MANKIKVRVIRRPTNPERYSASFYSLFVDSVPELVYRPLERELKTLGDDPVAVIEINFGDL